MNKKYFADVEWSKKLGHLFQDADWCWEHFITLGIIHAKTEKEKDKYRKFEIVHKTNISNMAQWSYPALHTFQSTPLCEGRQNRG